MRAGVASKTGLAEPRRNRSHSLVDYSTNSLVRLCVSVVSVASLAGWLGYITSGASCTVITTCTRVIIADKRPTGSEPCDLCSRRKQNGYLARGFSTVPRHAYEWLTRKDVVKRSRIDSHSDSGVLLFGRQFVLARTRLT